MTNGRLAYFFEGGAVTALDQSDGRQAWQVGPGQPGATVYGAWLWHGALVVFDELIEQHGYSRIESLDASTGKVHWSDDVSTYRVLGIPVMTSDGYLTFTTARGPVETLAVSDGKLVWTAPAYNEYVGAIAAAGPDVFVSAGGRVVAHRGYDGRQVWSLALPGIANPAFLVVDGMVLVTSGVGGGGQSTAMFALRPATGHVLWRLDVGSSFNPYSLLAWGPNGLAFQGYHLYLVDPATGRVDWVDSRVPGSVAMSASFPGVVVHTQATSDNSANWVLLQAQATRTGRLLWEKELAEPAGLTLVAAARFVAISSGAPPVDGPVTLAAYNLSSGHSLWITRVPAFVQSSMVLPANGQLLVDAADLTTGCFQAAAK